MTEFAGFLALVVILGLAAHPAESTKPAADIIYVSPDGNDHWSGRWSVPNMTDTDGPLATLDGARYAIRKLRDDKGELERPVEVWLRKGTYFLDTPFVLTARDSGPIAFKAFETATGVEDVTISGGRRITGFRKVEVNGHKMIAAPVPDVKEGKWNFTQLFVNDRRAERTRLPRDGYYQIASSPESNDWQHGQDHFNFKEGEIDPGWKNPGDVDIVVLTLWIESRMHIKSVDEAAHVVRLDKPTRFWIGSEFDHGKGARYYVENVFEALDTPGQWYLDRKEGMVYYYPRIGEDWQHETFIAPALEQIVRIEGDTRNRVEEIKFLNLHFAHTEHALPPDRSGSAQAAVQVPAAIELRNTRDCKIERCEIAHIGNYGVEVSGQSSGDSIQRCSIHDMGAGGVKIDGGTERTSVLDNEIFDGGKIFTSAVGVLIGDSPHNRIEHNSIHDLYYTGVSVGWVWGYGKSEAVDNKVEFNHIYNIGKGVLSDMGGIYTLGISPGTVIRNNLIHDCQSFDYGGWGIYTDEGSSNILIENNIVYRTKTGGFHQHYGKENILRNNIFAFAKVQQLQRTRTEPHTSFTFERNIVYYDEGAMIGGNWTEDRYNMDYNLYFDASLKPVTFEGASLDEWKKRGHDQHTIIDDPRFVDPRSGNFTLPSNSPALKLGFKQIDTSTVGPREKAGVE